MSQRILDFEKSDDKFVEAASNPSRRAALIKRFVLTRKWSVIFFLFFVLLGPATTLLELGVAYSTALFAAGIMMGLLITADVLIKILKLVERLESQSKQPDSKTE